MVQLKRNSLMLKCLNDCFINQYVGNTATAVTIYSMKRNILDELNLAVYLSKEVIHELGSNLKTKASESYPTCSSLVT